VSLLLVTDLGEATFIYLGYSPRYIAGLKHRQLVRQVGVLAEDLMANSTTSIVIKPTAAFSRADTFVFGSADGAGSFQRYLAMTTDLETWLMTLPEVGVGPLVEKFSKFSLFNQVADFDIKSNSNSNSMSPWIIACELTPESSCETTPLNEHFPYDLYNFSRAHVEAFAACRAGKEIASVYSSDSIPASGYYSDSSYVFDF
jgi:hypothetical protein